MDIDTYSKILDTARIVRYQVQDIAGEDEQDLCGYCAIASAKLWKDLNSVGIKAEIHAWVSEFEDAHVFLIVDDHVLDITATQFSELETIEVYLCHSREMQYYFHTSSEVFETPKQLKKWQTSTGWPSSQIAII